MAGMPKYSQLYVFKSQLRDLESKGSPDAAHCFCNPAMSLFSWEKSDLKTWTWPLITYNDKLNRANGHKQISKSNGESKSQSTLAWQVCEGSAVGVVKRSLFLTSVTVGLLGVVALSREAARVTIPDLLLLHLLLQNELSQTRLNLHTHTID